MERLRRFISPFGIEGERKPSSTFAFSIEGYTFLVEASTLDQVDYIKRVIAPVRPFLIPREQPDIHLIVLLDQDGAFVRKLAQLQGKEIYKATDFTYGVLNSEVYYFLYKGEFVNFSYEEGNRMIHLCTGLHPEFGISSFIKVNLLHLYREKYKEFLVLHAGSVLHLPTDTGIIFADASDEEEGIAKGKTTSVLAAVVNPSREFAFCSDDEVILAVDAATNDLISLHFPNEVTLRDGTLRAIKSDGYNLRLEHWEGRDSQTGERAFSSTPGALQELGFPLASPISRIGYWIFVDLSPGKKYSFEPLSESAAFKSFVRSIFKRRMAQSRGNIHWAELGVEDLNKELLDVDFVAAERIYSRLIENGTVFLKMNGGTDRKSLYRTSETLVKDG